MSKDDLPGRQRRSMRLPGWDYSTPASYFLTLVTFQRECLFGEIMDGRMVLSPIGRIAEEHWCLIPQHFPGVELSAHAIMPNHVHGIIMIRSDMAFVGATHDVVGATHDARDAVGATHDAVGATQWVAPTMDRWGDPTGTTGPARPNGPKRGSIGAIVGAYKMSVTRRIERECDRANIWQRNYYEHIIRDDEAYKRISWYIETNVENWAADEENPVK
jgi:REP element-mobilizing transposase RayT